MAQRRYHGTEDPPRRVVSKDAAYWGPDAVRRIVRRNPPVSNSVTQVDTMARGRKPKPAEIHILEGTFRADRHDKEAGSVIGQPLTEVPTPRGLDDVGIQHWHEAATILIAMGILAESDLPSLKLYAETQAEIARCDADIAERGRTQFNAKTGMEYDRPTVKHRAAALARLLALFAKLGFTPADRRGLPKANTETKPAVLTRRR